MLFAIFNNLSDIVLGLTWSIFIGWSAYKIGRWRGRRS